MINGFAMNGQTLAPGLDWTRSYWPDEDQNGNHVIRSESGEDWFYDIAVSKNTITNTPNGVICAGYQRDQCVSTPGSDCETYFNSAKVPHYCLVRDKLHLAFNGFGTLWFADFNGEMKWYKSYGKGNPEWLEFLSVTQANDGNYLVGGQGFKDNKLLNPIAGGAAFQTSNNLQGLTGYIAKIDANTHDIIWEYYYNMYDVANANVAWQNYGGSIYSIVEDPATGNITAIGKMNGYNSINNNLDGARVGVFYLNANGEILHRSLISEFNGSFPLAAEGLGLIKSDITPNRYYISGSAQSTSSGTNWLGYLIKLDINMANSNPFTYTTKLIGNPSFSRNFVYDLEEMPNGHIAVPCAEECINTYGPCSKFKLYDFEPINLYNNLITDMGNIFAYDNRFGIEKTNDGGVIIISSRKNSVGNFTFNVNTSDNLAELQFGPTLNDSFAGINTTNNKEKYKCNNGYWYTSAVFTKFDASLTQQWQKQYEFKKYDNNAINRGDITHHECVYQVVQSPDGGYIACGNTSQNLDDHYLIKINGDCGNQINYDYSYGTSISAGITTWSTNKKIKGELKINNGGHLIIDAATIEFADTRQVDEPTRIIIKKGGKLTLKNGAKLTSVSCANAMWDGIEIQGGIGDEQTLTGAVNVVTGFGGASTNQGYLEINNATIEKARYAIANTRMIYDDEKDFEYKPDGSMQGAGIVQAYKCTFKDNWRDADLQGYISPTNTANKNTFLECNFIATGAMPIKGFMQDDEHEGEYKGKRAFVYLNNIEGVKILGCTFENNSLDAKHKRGTAIESIDAPFTMMNGGLANLPNKIKGLYMGVNASATHPCNQALAISGVQMQNVRKGIGVGCFTLPIPVVLYNKIELDGSIAPEEEDNETAWGIHLTANKGYIVEENIVNGTYGINPTIEQLGIVVNNRHDQNTRLYRNTLNTLTKGNYDFGQNAGITSTTADQGLELKCNTFTNSYASDVLLTEDIGSNGMIKLNQGKCTPFLTDAANNIVSAQVNTLTNLRMGDAVNPYNYHQYNLQQYIPTSFDALVTDQNCGNPNGSPTHLDFCPIKNIIPTSGIVITGNWDVQLEVMDYLNNQLNAMENTNLDYTFLKTKLNTAENYFYAKCQSEASLGLAKIIEYLNTKPNKSIQDKLILANAYIANTKYADAKIILNGLATTDADILAQINILQTYIPRAEGKKTWRDASNLFKANCAANAYTYNKVANETKSVINHFLNGTPEVYRLPSVNTSSRLANTSINKKVVIKNQEIIVSIFPNPTSNFLILKFDSPILSETNYSILDVSGKIIIGGSIAPKIINKQIDFNLSKGLYFIKINATIFKFIVE
jgi:hypothetical protein